MTSKKYAEAFTVSIFFRLKKKQDYFTSTLRWTVFWLVEETGAPREKLRVFWQDIWDLNIGFERCCNLESCFRPYNFKWRP